MKIWTAWIQGRENAPSHVKKIFDLWEKLNPSHELKVLESEQISEIINQLGINQMVITPQIKTDLVRLHLLKEHGGVWVDATLLPTMSLDKWLTSDLKRSGFFAFTSSGAPELVVQSWFLYAAPDNKLINEWLKLFVDYFRSPRYYATIKRAVYHCRIIDFMKYQKAIKNKDYLFFIDPKRGRDCSIYPYMVICYTLKYILETQSEIKQIWEATPKLYNRVPSMIGDWALDNDTPIETFIDLATDVLHFSPVHKLNHRDSRFGLLIDHSYDRLSTGIDTNLMSFSRNH